MTRRAAWWNFGTRVACRTPRRLAGSAAILLLGVPMAAPAAAAPAAELALDPRLQAFVDAEHGFARMAREKGTKEAFLAHLAPEAVIFRPGPVPAVQWYEGRPASKGLLQWTPDFVTCAAAGDLGYTSGPWEYRAAADGPVIATGHYVTIWRKDAAGTLRAVIDTGIDHAADAGHDTSLKWRLPGAVAAGTRRREGEPAGAQAGEAALLALERDFAREAASSGWQMAFGAHAAADVRVYRPATPPMVGKEAAMLGAAREGTLTCTPVAAHTSAAGDLGYTYGTLAFHPQAAPQDSLEAAAYVRIWRRRPDGSCEIALDVQSPMPAPVKKP
jgi:ketosteroid isomerase-like protein